LAGKFGNEDLVLVLGLNEPRNLRIFATTFKDGDPSFAGPLAGVSLGLKCFHIFELKEDVPAAVWSAEMGMKELEIEDDELAEIGQTMQEFRAN